MWNRSNLTVVDVSYGELNNENVLHSVPLEQACMNLENGFHRKEISKALRGYFTKITDL